MKFRKKLATMPLMFLFCGSMMAQNQTGGGDSQPIQLTWDYSKPGSGNIQRPKMPQQNPTVYLNGHTLYVDDRLADYTLELYQGDEVAYQHYILYGESSIELPSSLSGEYVIRFVNADGNAYVGVITL